MTRARGPAMLEIVRRLALLLLLWPGVARAQIDADFPPPDGPGKVRTPEPPAHVEESRGDAPRDVAHLALGLGAHVGFGIAPALAAGAQASVEVATYRWSLGLEGRYDLPATGDTAGGVRARTWLTGVSFVPCARSQALWACGVVMAAHVATSGRDDQGEARDSWFVLGIGARMALHFAFGKDFALRFVGEALVHPIPWELSANGRSMYRSSVVSTTIGPALVHAF